MKVFTAPKEGYYYTSAAMITTTPTGKYEVVRNPEKSWWKFWKPDTIQKEIIEVKETNTGAKIIYCHSGQTITARYLNRI